MLPAPTRVTVAGGAEAVTDLVPTPAAPSLSVTVTRTVLVPAAVYVRVAVRVRRAAAVEADESALRSCVRPPCGGGRGTIHDSRDRHGELSRARSTVLVGDGDTHHIRAGRGVGVGRGDRIGLAGRAAGRSRRGVAPVDRVRPGPVVQPRGAEGGAERIGGAQVNGLTGSGIHRRGRIG